MSDELMTAELPIVPEILLSFGMPGKQAHRKFLQEIEAAQFNLDILRDFESGEDRLTEWMAENENDATQEYADVAAEVEAEEKSDEETKAAELKALEEKYAAKESERQKRLAAAREAVVESAGEELEIITEDDRADAVTGWDLAQASLEDYKRRAIKSLQNRKVANPEYNATEAAEKGDAYTVPQYVDVEAVINTIKLPSIGIGKKVSARAAKGGWKPRWKNAVVDGETVQDPRVSGVASFLGIQPDTLLKSFERHFSQDTFKDAPEGKEFSFVIPNLNGKSHSVTVTKGAFATKK